MGDGEGERIDRPQRHADEDELVEPEMVDEPLGVGDLSADRIVQVVGPVAVAVAALVERDAVVVVAQGEAAQIPGVCIERAAVQKDDRRQMLVAPIEVVEAHPPEVKLVAFRQHDAIKAEPGADGRLRQVLAVFVGG